MDWLITYLGLLSIYQSFWHWDMGRFYEMATVN
jgi:hypothetical protein